MERAGGDGVRLAAVDDADEPSIEERRTLVASVDIGEEGVCI